MRRTILAAACLLALIVIALPASSATKRLSAVLRTDYFVVHYNPSDPELARIMAVGAREHLLRISATLDYKPDKHRPFSLYVYPSHRGFIEAGGLRARKFTVGTTALANEAISMDASGFFELPDVILAHEVTHAVIFRILRWNAEGLPLWFNEGLAKYESEETVGDDVGLLADAAASGTLISLQSLQTAFPDDRTDLAYVESDSAIRYLVKRYGNSAPRSVLQKMSHGKSFDAAMLDSVGVSGDRFMNQWFAHVTRRYWLVKWTRIGSGGLGALMALLVVIAFFRRRRQKIEAAKKWDEEEFDEAMRRQLGNDWWR